jgi:NADH dehydrogenase/NADH:ubiquinone oxidoreductase subunit G
MKKILFTVLAISTITFTACNSGNGKNEQEGHDMNKMNKDTAQHATTADDKDVKAVSVTFTNVDAKATAYIKEIVDHYLHVKNALANDNSSEAASGAKAMENAIGKLDKSLLTVEQKKAYDANEEELKEHAEHIGKNGDNIKHQRSHFVQMSEVVYELVKNFGAGRPLYHDHCPMARDNQGAMWLSEVKEIKNPYFGSEMFKCGRVEEMIK